MSDKETGPSSAAAVEELALSDIRANLPRHLNIVPRQVREEALRKLVFRVCEQLANPILDDAARGRIFDAFFETVETSNVPSSSVYFSLAREIHSYYNSQTELDAGCAFVLTRVTEFVLESGSLQRAPLPQRIDEEALGLVMVLLADPKLPIPAVHALCEEVLSGSEGLRYSGVYIYALANPNCPVHILEKCALSKDSWKRAPAMANLNCPEHARVGAALLDTTSGGS